VRQGREAEACATWAAIVKEKAGTVQAQKALFDLAIHTMETAGDYAAACQWYRAGAATHPEDKALQVCARLWETEMYFFADNLSSADRVEALQALGEEWAGEEAQGLAYLRLSQYYRDRRDEANLVRWYERAIAASPRAPYVPCAMLTRAEELLGMSPEAKAGTGFVRTDTAAGLKELERILAWSDENGPTKLANEALFLMGRTHGELGEKEEAESWFLLLAARDPGGEWGAHGAREAAQIALLTHPEDAVELCTNVSERLARATWVRPGELPVWQREVGAILRQAKASTTPPSNRAAVWAPLSARDAAETRGAWPGNSYTEQTQNGCGGDCIPLSGPVYWSKQAIDIAYTDCVSGYFWQSCHWLKQVYCAKWAFFYASNCPDTPDHWGNCLTSVLANDGITTCP
jgi:tetratricopeptide (TPR) repeat protein